MPFTEGQLRNEVLPDAVDIALEAGVRDHYLLRLLEETLSQDVIKRLSAATMADHAFFAKVEQVTLLDYDDKAGYQ